jgi:hypothetical protein
MIIDLRNYPSEFMVFALGSLLVGRDVEFVRFTNAGLSNPGAFTGRNPCHLAQRIPITRVRLLFWSTKSLRARQSTPAWPSAPPRMPWLWVAPPQGPIAMCHRSLCPEVYGPPTQRLGIIPDLEVKPTIAGIRAGRDEVSRGGVASDSRTGDASAKIEKMAKP